MVKVKQQANKRTEQESSSDLHPSHALGIVVDSMLTFNLGSGAQVPTRSFPLKN
jgi:hypothetical protein